MSASGPPAPEGVTPTAWERVYRISLVLVVVGAVLLAVSSAIGFWAGSTGSYPASSWTGLALYTFATAGGMLILLAGTVAYYHRAGLKIGRRKA